MPLRRDQFKRNDKPDGVLTTANGISPTITTVQLQQRQQQGLQQTKEPDGVLSTVNGISPTTTTTTTTKTTTRTATDKGT